MYQLYIVIVTLPQKKQQLSQTLTVKLSDV